MGIIEIAVPTNTVLIVIMIGVTLFFDIVEIKKHLKTRDRILNALNRNKHKKTKSELELLEKFYAESETYKRI